jgi:hypothetical protein
MNAPDFLEKKPEPRMIQRLYHGRKIMVWDGVVDASKVNGWVDNPRIEIERRKRQEEIGNRELNQDEVFDLIKKERSFKLKELRDDILDNGLREPIVLTYTGKLLDGNRRYFALRFALEGIPKSDPSRSDFSKIHCYVLTKDATDEDERNVLVEENFAPSLKLEWPDYVKALSIKDEAERGMNVADLSAKFSWTKSKIKETVKIWEIIDDFLAFATSDIDLEDESLGGMGLSEIEAEMIAAKSYQYFNEAQKSFYTDLKVDFNFKSQFFRWICDGKFSSFPEVRIAYKAWNDSEAKRILMGPEPSAAKDAKAVIDYKSRINKDFEDVNERIGSFSDFLWKLSAEQICSLSDNSVEKLRAALDEVTNMAISVKENSGQST